MADEILIGAMAAALGYVGQKVLGPTLDTLGQDLNKVYAKGRDNILSAAYKKIENPEDDKRANLRVAHDVFINGAFTEDEICAEYFGGVLASSRSLDGKDDSAIFYVDLIKSMSAKQLHLHYVLYHSLNTMLVARGMTINVGNYMTLSENPILFLTQELLDLGLTIFEDGTILHNLGLSQEYEINHEEFGDGLHYTRFIASIPGILLYAVAHNRLMEWRQFSQINFGTFGDISRPRCCAWDLEKLSELTVGPTSSSA